MKRLIMFLAVLNAVDASAQAPQTPPAQQPQPTPPSVEVSGMIMPGVQQLDNATNSSKLTEYRDLQDNFYLPTISFSVNHPTTGRFFDLSGTNVSRDDQTILARAGRPGLWSIGVDWIEVPHNYSNKAVTPYIQRTPGLLGVPDTVPVTFKKLATAAPDTAGVLASDDLIAAYQQTFLAPAPLGTQTNTGRFAATWSGADAVTLGVAYDRRDKSGSKATFGPIGDRPPRTLNIQLAEPVDYRTNDLTFAAEHDGGTYQIRGEYLYSNFANQIDTLQWQNIYTTAAPGATYDVWDRSVSVYGVRPLPPDNRYHNLMASFGTDLPFDSRLSANAAYGRLEQNEALLPYSYNVDQLVVKDLPRATADAQIRTTSFNADYVVSPVPRLQLRGFFRWYDLDNQTPSSRWQYVTSDTSNLNGTVAYVNKRVSLPYAWARQNVGAEGTWRLPRRSSLSFEYERENVARDHREADTGEDILRAIWRTRAARWANVEVRYLQGWRDGGTYNNEVTHEGYWYAPAEANDQNNPALTFDNHPDMRRFDVSDRLRRQFDVRINLTPHDLVALSGYVRYRKDDFDSDATPSQPLLGTGLADEQAVSPGDQLGRLDDTRTRYGLDVFVQPDPRVSLNAFLNYDKGTAHDRSLEFNENNKANPSAVANAELGPWTRASSQWAADHDDRTWSAGLGTTIALIPERLTLTADYALSLAGVDIAYAGYGVTNFDGTPFPPNHQFAFSTPSTINEDLHIATIRFEIPVRTVTLLASYSYENYSLDDWQQESFTPWVEPVGAETLLRDTSRSYQWGNRLFNLGTLLAPSYSAHIGFIGFSYRF
jgi:MtrB/PioB family decaheme-associated outer membrane protein